MAEKANQIVLNEKAINDINAYLGEVPLKYALPILDYIGKLGNEQGYAPTKQKQEESK